MYLRVWMDHGVWGLATYLGLLVSSLLLFAAHRHWPGVTLLGLVILNGVFSHDIIDDKTFLILLGAALAACSLEAPHRRQLAA